MVNKIKFDVDDYQPSDSETEYTERESKLLKKFAGQQKQQNSDSEQELLPFDAQEEDSEFEDDDDDDLGKFESDSEDDAADEGDDLQLGWGKDKRTYYGPNFVDNDYSTYNEKEEELAQFEEKEAKEIQQKLAKQLDEADFSLDVFTVAADDSDGETDKLQSKLQTDLSDMSQRQKLQLFRKEAPEFDGLVSDFQKHLSECKDLLKPALDFLKSKGQETHPLYDFAQTKYEISVNYCTNVAFYLVLKAKRISIKNHPIVRRLNQFRQLLLQLEEKFENIIKPQLEQLIEDIAEDKDIEFEQVKQTLGTEKSKKKSGILRNLKKVMDQDSDSGSEQSDGEDDFLQEAKRFKKMTEMNSDSDDGLEGDEAEDDGPEQVDGDGKVKRRIPYLISKNKGLTAHKKKELRNPRVKNRNRFNKAVVRRKGAVRPVRKETARYGGEASGIKAFVRRSVKIKS